MRRSLNIITTLLIIPSYSFTPPITTVTLPPRLTKSICQICRRSTSTVQYAGRLGKDSVNDDDFMEVSLSDDDLLSFLSDHDDEGEPDVEDLLAFESALDVESLDDFSDDIASANLLRALSSETLPVDMVVGDESLPGDIGFDPLGFSKLDPFVVLHKNRLNLIDGTRQVKKRPSSLIIRDYRDCEVRHGRVAMLAAILWPLQELWDRIVFPSDYEFSVIFGGPTLPFVPLFMVFSILGLGYLDIWANANKKETGEARLPGDCFWDPLSIMVGATYEEKRAMQEREIWNGRAAMVAFVIYILEEVVTRRGVVNIDMNQWFFEPAIVIPQVEDWLDPMPTAIPLTQ